MPPTDEEITLAALQYVRKVSGYRQPSRANQAAFDAAVAEVAAATAQLLDSIAGLRWVLAGKPIVTVSRCGLNRSIAHRRLCD